MKEIPFKNKALIKRKLLQVQIIKSHVEELEEGRKTKLTDLMMTMISQLLL